MTDRALRALSALVTAAVSVFVAMFAHVVGGGAIPGAVTLALSFALGALICLALSSVAASLWRVLVAVTLSQAGFHGLFTITGTAGSLTLAHQHGGATAHVMADPASGAPMLAAHSLAALATAVMVLLGRRTLETMARLARRVSVALSSFELLPVRHSGPTAIPSPRVPIRPLSLALLGSLRHRGPPIGI